MITEIFSYACNLDLKYSRVYDEFIITDTNIKEDWRLVKIFCIQLRYSNYAHAFLSNSLWKSGRGEQLSKQKAARSSEGFDFVPTR